MLRESKATIETQTQVLLNLQKQMEAKKTDIEKIELDYEDYAEYKKKEIEELKKERMDLKRQSAVYASEINVMKVECD
jgi:hypothetical protein